MGKVVKPKRKVLKRVRTKLKVVSKRKKPIVHVVGIDKFPKEAQELKYLGGYQKGRHIYIRKGGRNEDSHKHHEIYHYMKNHAGHPRSPNRYIRDELEADMYALKKTGKPKHIMPQINAIMTDVHDDYKISGKKTIRVMSEEMRKRDVPKAWKGDFNHIVSKYLRDMYKNRKIPKDILV